MVKNRKVILSFLFLAWTIIFVHSIIPHHHFDEVSAKENYCHHEHHDSEVFSFNTELDGCNDGSSEYVCHFHVKVLTQISIDNIFICTKENTLYSNASCVKTNHYSFYQNLVSVEFPKTNYLRGPPQFA